MSNFKLTGGKKLSSLTEVEIKEILELYRNGENVTEIAKTYQLSGTAVVSQLAKRNGIPLRNPGRLLKRGPTLDEEITSLRQRLSQLESKRRELCIKFEAVDDTTIKVYGVTESFVKLEGMVKLLEFIKHKFPQRA